MHFVAIGLNSRAELFKQVRRVGYTCRTFLKVQQGYAGECTHYSGIQCVSPFMYNHWIL